MSQPFWFDDGRTVEERSMQGVREIAETTERDRAFKKSLGWCDACIAGEHIKCINRGIAAVDGKICFCSLCESINKDAEDEQVESGE